MNTNFTPKTLKIVPVEYLDGVIQPSICDEHDEQICLVEIGKENYAPYLAAAPEMYEMLVYYAGQYGCKCGHPACFKCKDTMETEAILKKARGEK